MFLRFRIRLARRWVRRCARRFLRRRRSFAWTERFRSRGLALRDWRLRWKGGSFSSVHVLIAGVALGGVVVLLVRAGPSAESPAGAVERQDSIDVSSVQEDLAATPGLQTDSVVSPSLQEGPMAALYASPRDWADSVPIPAWVLQSGGAFGRLYRPLGSAGGTVRGSLGERGASPTASRPPSASPWIPTPLVLRQQGRFVRLEDLKLGGASLNSALHRAPGALRLLGDCDVRVTMDSPVSATTWQGSLSGPLGDWLAHLAVPAEDCQRAKGRMYPRTPPSAEMREGLARALSQSRDWWDEPVRFSPSDLKEFVVSAPAADGTRYAWAVARQKPQGTQMAPPPPQPQVGFVARRAAGGTWSLVWALYTSDQEERIALAGVYDSDRDRMPEGIFVHRAPEVVRVLRIAPTAAGVWDVVEDRAVGGIR